MEKIRKTLYATIFAFFALILFAFMMASSAKPAAKNAKQPAAPQQMPQQETQQPLENNNQETVMQAENTEGNTNMETNTSKSIIVYFSWGGNTRYIAQIIQNKTGADIFELETVNPYPTDYHETTVVAKKEIDEQTMPELKQNVDISNYDKIFVGTPAWWYTMAPAVHTFLSSNNFTGKTIIPFITHGGGGEYSIAGEMGQYAQGSVISRSISIQGKGNSETEREIDEWLKEIK